MGDIIDGVVGGIIVGVSGRGIGIVVVAGIGV